MTKSTVLSDRELLEQFREAYPYFKSIRQIASVPQDDFVRRYAEAAFGCDSRLARRVHQTALHIQEQTALIWANLKDVASPYLQQTLFSNIPQDFLDHQQSIPGYDRLFGSLDFLESDHARSIFGPAAYFVDLLRFVETYITHKEPGAIPPALMLDARRPDLAHIKLDKGATYDLMPYIDLVIEVLENMVRTQENPNAYQVVAAAGFPMNLPFDLPLLEIRTYLKQLKTSLYEIYQCFAPLNGAVDPLAAETLELSPGEYQRIAHEISGEDELTSSYGLAYAGLSDPSALANVKDFLQQTGLSRKELNDLVFQDLDRHEVNAGLSRLFFINNVDDGLGYLMIQQNVDDGLGYLMIQQDENRPLDPSYDSETLVNLSLLKLERIYRFLKLARKLNWSFADLDWAIRSLGELYIPEPSLRFDGLNDAVLCRNVKTDLVVDTFTIEAWVCPQRAGAHPILCKGSKAGQTSQELHFLFWIDAEGRLAFYDKTLLAKDEQRQNDKLEVGYYIRSQQTLPLGAFSHVALTVSGRTVSFYLNGKLAPLAPMYVLDAQAFTALERAGVAQTVRDKLTSLNLDRPLTSAKFAAAIQPAVKPEIGNQQELTNKILEAALITSNLLKGIGGDLDIGGNLDGHFFAGSIKDLRLWQEVLSQTDIETNRYRRLTGSEPNLVGYWPLLESQSKRMDDFTANGHHGILGGAGLATQPVWIHQDLVLDPLPRLQAYHFDGGDQYLAGAAIQGMNQHLSKLTLEAWVMRKAASEQVILCKGQAATNERHFQFGVDAEGLLVFQSNARGATEYKSQTGINLNKWTHLCVTLAERTLTFYVNGALVATEIIPAGLLAPVGDRLQIGRGFAGDPFNGLIREVRIWSTARTAKQILDHMHRPLTQVEGAGLLGYWRLEAVESFTNNGIAHAYARDRSVNRNHLHLGGVLEDYQPTRTPLTAVIAQRPVAAKGAVLAFDGENDLLVIENTDNFGLGRYECWTLELWFKSTTTRRPARKEVIFVQGDVEAGLNLYLDDGKLNVLAWSADYGATNVRQIALSSAPLDLERWHHVAITQDESQALDQVQIKAYLDGALFGEAQNSFPLSPVGAAYLGGMARAGGQLRFDGAYVETATAHPLHHFSGQMADLRLWNRAKRAAEILAGQYIAADSNDPHLAAYLPLDEGEGDTCTDLSTAKELCATQAYTGLMQKHNIVFATGGAGFDLENVYAHYCPDDTVLDWQNYVYTGRMRISDPNGGIGVTFYSRHPAQQDRFYWLRRYAERSTFHLVHHPHNLQTFGVAPIDTGIAPQANTWQRFRIEVEDQLTLGAHGRTSIKVKLWPDGAEEPAAYAVETFDDTQDRISAGTVGLWAFGPGEKHFDDLAVSDLNGAHYLLAESFEVHAADADPVGWRQTSARVQHDLAANLFQTNLVSQQRFFGTNSTVDHIHAHYYPTDQAVNVQTWVSYEYSGCMKMSDEEGGIGVTFFSQFPNRAAYYALRRRADDDAAFQLVGYPNTNEAGGSKLSSLTKDGEVKPAPNRWYRFRIAVTHVPDYRASGQSTPKPTTFIKAKVWPDGQPEPLDYQYEALDDVNPLTAGTVGMWTAGDGAKYFDDLKVYLLDENFEAISVGQRPTDWRDTATRNQYEYISDINLFKTQQFEDNMAHWQTTDQYPLWANPMLLSFDGQRHYLAAAAPPPSPAAPPHTSFTIEAWVYLSQMQENPILSQGESLQRRPDFCFGLDSTGRLTLTQAITGGSLEPIAVGTTLVPVNELTHIALSVTPDQAIFYINGREDSHLPLSSALTLQGPHWEMGSNIADQYFNGYIQEVRLWQTARSAAQLAASAYESPYQLRRKYGNALLAYWPLLETSGIYAHHLAQGSQGMVAGQNMRDPASEAERMTMRLGGLATARYPLRTDDPLRDPGAFWTPDRPVVQFSAAEDIIRISTPPTGGQPVQRRTVEVWFRVADKYLASRKQVIYYEGNEQQGLLIYIFDGQLYFGSYGGPIWAGEWLATNRVASGRWHHAVLVLDGRAEIRPGSLQAFLDGAAVGACRGVELKIAAVSFSLGGIADAASSGIRFHDQAPVAATAKHFLQGQVLELRRWKTALLPQEIHAIWEGQVAGDDSSDPSTLQAGDPAMLEHWWKAEELLNQASNPDGRKQRLGSWPEYPLPHNSLDRAALSNLAAIRTLQAQHGLSVERLCALWYGIKHIGREDGRTLFDEVFNAQANSVRWDYYLQPTRWDVGGQGNLEQDRAIRNRLMGALQLSNANLNVFVATLSGADASVVTLDNDYLGRLYRLVQSARLLRLNVLEYTRLLTILGLQAKPQVSLEDFMQLSARVDWMRRTGIDVAALDFLTNDRSGSGATVTLNEVPLRALATSLRSAAADFLARGESFVSEVTSQAQSLAIFTFLRDPGEDRPSVINEKGAVAAAFATAPDFAALAATPDWRALLAPLGDSQEWSVALAAELATRLHWKVGLRGGLVALGLDPKRTEADAILQRLQDNGWVSAEGTVREDLLPTAQLLTAALASTNGGQNPIQLPASVTVAKILQFLNDQRNAQQGLLQALRQHDYSNANGVVTENRAIRDSELAQLFTTPQPSAVLAGVREALVQRQAVQTQIGETLLRLRRALDSALVEALAGLFDTDASLTETVFSHFQPQMSSARLIELIFTIEDNQPIAVALAGNPDGYLYKLSKVFFLTAEFGLTMPELGALLATPAIFGVQQVLKPDLADLDSLHAYRELRTALSGSEGVLLDLLIQQNAKSDARLDLIAKLTGWDAAQLQVLAEYFGAANGSRLIWLHRLKACFDLAQAMGADVKFLIQLADIAKDRLSDLPLPVLPDDKETRFFSSAVFTANQQHAAALRNLLMARYDRQQWPSIDRRIHDELAVQQRDALLSRAMLKVGPDYIGRKDADLLYEYLLLDVQMGSVVDASRIQQAIASVQLYVQRCLMNLEKGVQPEWIPQTQWEWMKNYRVWEANRKVFLYPENYIEPELRDSKTPLFAELEQELTQSEINQAAVEKAFTHYLDKFREISNLKIVGSYLHKEFEPEDGPEQQVKSQTLYLIGRTNTQPALFYYREHVQTPLGGSWLPWKKIDLTINADFVTPVYAFNKLFLFWPEFVQQKKSIEPQLSQSILDLYDVDFLNTMFPDPTAGTQTELVSLENELALEPDWGPAYFRAGDLILLIAGKKKLLTRQQAARQALTQELSSGYILKLDEKRWKIGLDGYLINTKTSERINSWIDVYNTTIKYSYYNFSKTWVQPQIYAALNNELAEDVHRDPRWQRLYAQQVVQLTSGGTDQVEKDVRVLHVDQATDIKADLPNFDMNQLTWSFWVRWENRAPGGWLGWKFTITEALKQLWPKDLSTGLSDDVWEAIGKELVKEKPVEITSASLEKTVTLLDYSNEKLYVTATNLVTGITGREAVETAAISTASSTRTALDHTNNNNFTGAATSAAEAEAMALKETFWHAPEIAKLAGYAEQAAKKAAEDIDNANAQASAKAAREAANTANQAAQIARSIEQFRPKWESKSVRLTVRFGQTGETLTIDLAYDVWQQVALVLQKK